MQDPDDEDGTLSQPDIPADSKEMAGQTLATKSTAGAGLPTSNTGKKKTLSDLAKGAIFREVVFAKVREEKEKVEREKEARAAEEKAKRRSYNPPPK